MLPVEIVEGWLEKKERKKEKRWLEIKSNQSEGLSLWCFS